MMGGSERLHLLNAAIVAVCSVVILKWVWSALNTVWLVPKRQERRLRQQGLTGNSYRLLIGDMKQSQTLRNQALQKPMPFTHHYFPRINPFLHSLLASSSGSNCFTWMGPVPVITITQPELIKEVFSRMNDFRKHKMNPLTLLLAPGLVTYEGQKWAQHRRLTNSAFQIEKLKLMVPAFRCSIMKMVSKWEDMAGKDGVEVDVLPYLMDLTGEAISRAAFGSSYEDGQRIFSLLTQQKELIIRLLRFVYIPGWKYIPTRGKKKMNELNNEIHTLMKNIIDGRKKAMEAGEDPKNDLLGMLMDACNTEERTSSDRSEKKGRIAMSLTEMIDECKLFYAAGQENNALLLAWTMVMLGRYTEWQAKAREEVLATFGVNAPHYDGLARLNIVTMILHEVLRLYPPVVATSRRIYDRETKLGELSVPHGVAVSVSILHAHTDPNVWGDDAEMFKPERFSVGVAKAANGTISYFPFGWGPRICLGQNFALTEAKMAMAMILQRFTFELSPSYIHAPTSLISLQPQHGAHLILHPL